MCDDIYHLPACDSFLKDRFHLLTRIQDKTNRAVGWVQPNEVGLKSSVMLYAITLRQPWLEAVDLEPQGDGKPRYETSPMGVAHDGEVRQVIDDNFDKLIR